MTISLIIICILILGLLIWIITSWKVNSVDAPRYIVVSKAKEYEIRTYERYVVAETIVEGSRLAAVNAGFRILAAYIFGANTGKKKLAMNAPVGDTATGATEPTKLAMTAPVMTRNNSTTSHVVSFVMPRGETIDTLPKPLDSLIVFNVVPEHTVAARSFSWYATEARIQAQKHELKSALIRDGIIIEGAISYAGYTAPFTIPFMEKHEVIVRIQR
jgi:hypothetical protein